MTGHTGWVRGVATAVLDGRPVAVTTGNDATVRVWDLTTGQPRGEPMTGHTGSVRGVATAVLDGRPVAVTTSDDATVRVWDLTTGQLWRHPLHVVSPGTALATTLVDDVVTSVLAGQGVACVELHANDPLTAAVAQA
jgi:WD40 repeat protein